VAQLTVHSKGVLLRAEERSADIFTSVDMVIDKMQRQIDRYKSKRRNRYRSAPVEVAPPAFEEEETEDSRIVRTKRFRVTPMDPEEAIEQMELLGHSFFVFYDVEEGRINVVYSRRDGNYGLLQPELD
jgi:putative sigma-54 modulation protein